MNHDQGLKMYLLYIVYGSTIKLTLKYESTFDKFYDFMIKIDFKFYEILVKLGEK